MPELPEVETVRRDLEARMAGKVVKSLRVRRRDLREPVSAALARKVKNKRVREVARRAKYVLIGFEHGAMLMHLGMSGTVRADKAGAKPRKHDHVEWTVGRTVLRYNDPRRFGRILWVDGKKEHPLLKDAGLEPLGGGFSQKALAGICAGRRQPIKQLLMDGSKIAGVGNIYASEALHLAKVMPDRPAGEIVPAELGAIAKSIKLVLRRAIRAGGTSLRDHNRVDGKPGYFQLQHKVYGKEGEPCQTCGTPIARVVQGQRSTFFCPTCQR